MDDADAPDSVDHGSVACEPLGKGTTRRNERAQVDSRIGWTVAFPQGEKTRRTVRPLRPQVIGGDVERQPDDLRTRAQLLTERDQDAGAEAPSAQRGIERDADVGAGRLDAQTNDDLGCEPAVDEAGVRAPLRRARGEEAPQRIGGGAVERGQLVGGIERIVAASPCREGVDVAALHRTDRNDRPGGVVHWTMRLALIFAAALAVAAAGSRAVAAAAEPCTVQQFSAPEAPVTATYCSGGVAGGSVTVTQTYAANGKSFVRPLAIAIVTGAGASRATDDVDLTPLGIARTLHVHVSYANGAARMTGGLLTPGAIPVTPQDH